MKTMAFFNNKGGVGKTSLVYHVAWMMSLLGVKVLVADLDPQANVTRMFVMPEDIEALWDAPGGATIYRSIRPLMAGTGDVVIKAPIEISDRLYLLAGDLSLFEIGDQLSEAWAKCLLGDQRALRVTTAFSRILQGAGATVGAQIALIDVGPNLGAINRAALVATDYVVIPLSADLFAMRGLQNVGPKLREWRRGWSDRRQRAPQNLDFVLPSGAMTPIGYVISRYGEFMRGPIKTFQKWLNDAPSIYRSAFGESEPEQEISIDADPYELARLKDYRSLVPMAQEVNKPMFLLKPADGAIGGHQAAVAECRKDFRALATLLLEKAGIPLPEMYA
jgi:cellulose biosynthesis protein BcsQ